tara:strand:- start:481 stop:1161 length:681 start_codon:yes stop_codon:yes gene_type:complete
MAKFTKIIQENKEIFLIKKFIRLFRGKLTKKGRRRFSFVLAGGKSPIKLYKYLAKSKNIPWNKIDFFIGDERYVNENSRHSNIKICKKYLLNKITISNNQVYKISTKKKTISKSTINYEKKIKKYFLNKKVAFDLILLGIGNDGHIASLFKKNIKDKNKKNVSSIKRKDFSRITLTLKCLNNSKSIYLWAPTKRKKSIIKKILSDKEFLYPASFLNKKKSFLFYRN